MLILFLSDQMLKLTINKCIEATVMIQADLKFTQQLMEVISLDAIA